MRKNRFLFPNFPIFLLFFGLPRPNKYYTLYLALLQWLKKRKFPQKTPICPAFSWSIRQIPELTEGSPLICF
jgi:hypothetical protein